MNLTSPGIDDNRGIAEVAHVIGTACMVENDVPVDPPRDPVAKVTDDVAGITLAAVPLAELYTTLPTSFREEDGLVGEVRMGARGAAKSSLTYQCIAEPHTYLAAAGSL